MLYQGSGWQLRSSSFLFVKARSQLSGQPKVPLFFAAATAGVLWLLLYNRCTVRGFAPPLSRNTLFLLPLLCCQE